jgi:hypothetical protein
MSNGTSNTLSRRTYDCYVCEKQGFPNVWVHLAGKTADGKTIYLEADGVTAHRHKFKESGRNNSSEQAQTDTTADTIISLLREIDGKLNRLLAIEGQ